MAVAVFDIGKSSLKLVVCPADCRDVQSVATAPNVVTTSGLYPHFDTERIWTWLLEQLSAAARQFDIQAIIPVTHGATAALMMGEELALPVLDYEYEAPFTNGDAYAALRPPFSETYSPALPCGLNLGRQLWWQSAQFAKEFARVECILLYPQYWSWRLSGVRASEVTSIGCHTDLWQPEQKKLSSLVANQGWSRLFPAFQRAGAALGPVRPEIAKRTGLAPGTQVLNGIHDSNASYFRHLANYGDRPFSVLSTGTWVVAMGGAAPLRELDERRDCLANVDVNNHPVPCARFMGGREYEAIHASHGNLPHAEPATDDYVRAVIERGMFALPSFAPARSGPFADRVGRMQGPALRSNMEANALAALYLALMSDTCLGLIGSQGDIHVEGKLGADHTFLSILAALRPQQNLFVTDDASGTAVGAALLAAGTGSHTEVSRRAPRGDIPGIRNYAETWRVLASNG
jgi:L-fuculokinase